MNMNTNMNTKSVLKLVLNSTGIGVGLGISFALNEIAFSGITKETVGNLIKFPIRGVIISNTIVFGLMNSLLITKKMMDIASE